MREACMQRLIHTTRPLSEQDDTNRSDSSRVPTAARLLAPTRVHTLRRSACFRNMGFATRRKDKRGIQIAWITWRKTIKDIKAEGSLFEDIENGGYDFNIGPIPVTLSFLVRLASRLGGRRSQDLMGPRDAGAVTALDSLVTLHDGARLRRSA